ncbi:MAG TPA: 30S ribosomal protein S2 [Candidatus Dormibacteraeota bacterium]|nr:30S ribosomal protein S2 [Candidatus Dormibacteraeota bacterium]
MPVATLTELLQNGVHFGHQTSRWNPKMRHYIFASKGGIHIIDVSQTVDLLDSACQFAHDTVAQGGQILFVGTKKQAQDTIQEQCARSTQPFVVNRWMGGLLTNFEVVKRQLKRMAELVEMRERGVLATLSKKEQRRREDELDRLERNFGGITNMKRLPAAVFVVDPHKERLAVTEARKLEIPIIAITDTNCDPEEISQIIPGNDDAIRSVRLIVTRLVDAVMTGLDEHRQIELAQAQKAEADRQVQAEEARIAQLKADAEAEAEAARQAEVAAQAAESEGTESPPAEEAVAAPEGASA